MEDTSRIWSPVENEWLINVPSRSDVPARADMSKVDRSQCPFCPGSRDVPADYDTFVVDSAYPVVGTDQKHSAGGAYGYHRVLVYTPNHTARVADLTVERIAEMFAVIGGESDKMYGDPQIESVYVFEVFGDHFGPTVDHAHVQILGLPFKPRRLVDAVPCPFCMFDQDSVVSTSGGVTSVVPRFARYPFETVVSHVDHRNRLSDLSATECLDLAVSLKDMFARYRNSYGSIPPHVWAVVQAPKGVPETHLRVEILPLHSVSQRLKRPGGLEVGLGLYTNPLGHKKAVRTLREAFREGAEPHLARDRR